MDRPSHADPAPDLHTLQVQVLYRNMPTGVLASAINAAVLAAVEWSVVPHTPLLLGSPVCGWSLPRGHS